MRTIYTLGIALYSFILISSATAFDVANTAFVAGKYSTKNTANTTINGATRSAEPDYRYIGHHNVVAYQSVYSNAQYRYYYHPHYSGGINYLSIDLDMDTIVMGETLLAVPPAVKQRSLNYDEFMAQLGK